MKDRILIFIPMYNCEKQIPRVLERISQVENYKDIFAEIIVVDNQSKDNSIAVAKETIEKLKLPAKVLRNRENRSLGGSHKTAFLYAIENGFDYVIVLHGDDQGDIHDIVPFILDGTYCKYDSFLGSRFHKESKLINYSKFRIFGNHVFNAVVSVLIRKRITDLGSGLNMYKTEYLKPKFYMPFANNLTFNVYLLLYGVYSKSDFTFFPLTWKEDDQVSNAKLFSQSKEILGLTLKYAFGANKVFARKDNEFSAMTYDYDIVCDNVRGE